MSPAGIKGEERKEEKKETPMIDGKRFVQCAGGLFSAVIAAAAETDQTHELASLLTHILHNGCVSV